MTGSSRSEDAGGVPSAGLMVGIRSSGRQEPFRTITWLAQHLRPRGPASAPVGPFQHASCRTGFGQRIVSQPAIDWLSGPCDSEGLPLRPRPPDRCSAALPGGREGSPGEAVGTLGPLGHPPRPARPLLRRLVRRRPRVRGPGQPSRAAASGARALVVHEAFETIVCAAGSYAAVLTPNASVTSAPVRRADEHPPRARVEVGAGGRGRGEAAGRPSTISTPRSAHGSRAGSRSASTVMRRPSTTRASPSTVTGRPSLPPSCSRRAAARGWRTP